jgi:copper chaperone
MQTIYSVPGVSRAHCRVAITGAVEKVEGVALVDVDLARKDVTVIGPGFDDAAVRRAIDGAGYDVE